MENNFSLGLYLFILFLVIILLVLFILIPKRRPEVKINLEESDMDTEFRVLAEAMEVCESMSDYITLVKKVWKYEGRYGFKEVGKANAAELWRRMEILEETIVEPKYNETK